MNATLSHLLGLFAPAGAVSRCASAPTTERATLPANGWRLIRKSAGRSIRCFPGRVVITQESDPRDVLLVAGESYDVARNEHLYVQAEREAELRFACMLAANKRL